jgi:hypothetical protein
MKKKQDIRNSLRIDEQNIIDIQFLPGHQKPTFIVLHPVGNCL